MAQPPKSASHLRLRTYYLKRYPNTMYSLGEWRRYSQGIWAKIPELQVRKEMQLVAQTYSIAPVTNSLINSIYNLTKAYAYFSDDTLDSNHDLITFADCTLVVSGNLSRAHEPKDFVTSKLPFFYEPTAVSDIWDLVLTSTEAAYLPFLQEFSGYCMTPSTKHEIALWCYGEPGSGKSTFIAGLETVLGHRCCTLGLNEIERSQFALGQIPGKTLAISTEQPSSFIRSSHILNALISGEPIQWERKFVDPVSIRPHVKLLWAMNELPRIDSSGVGLFRRVIPVPWKKVEKPDPRIKEEIIPTLGAAIFNWAFAGLQRLLARGRFEIPAGLLAERESYRLQNDTIQAFLDDRCQRVSLMDESGHYNKVQSSVLHVEYKNWCTLTTHKPLSSTAFASEMRRLGIQRIDSDGKRYWVGILIKPDESEISVN